MKIYAIISESDKRKTTRGWLIYDPASERFFMELPRKIDAWKAPLPFGAFVRRGIYHIGSDWAMKWVQNRIVPADRQNLGMILKANGMKRYDHYRLLLLADGRCAQDDLFLQPVNPEELPEELNLRLSKKVSDVIPLSGSRLMVMFRDDTSRVVDAFKLPVNEISFSHFLREEERFRQVRVTPLGNGVEWDEAHCIPAETLYENGVLLPISEKDMTSFVRHRTMDTADVAEYLHCSRQYVNQLVKEEKLHPVHSGAKYNLFQKSEIEAYYG